MIELPDECSNTLVHALVHIGSAHEAIDDKDQVLHDLRIVEAVIKNVIRKRFLDWTKGLLSGVAVTLGATLFVIFVVTRSL